MVIWSALTLRMAEKKRGRIKKKREKRGINIWYINKNNKKEEKENESILRWKKKLRLVNKRTLADMKEYICPPPPLPPPPSFLTLPYSSSSCSPSFSLVDYFPKHRGLLLIHLRPARFVVPIFTAHLLLSAGGSSTAVLKFDDRIRNSGGWFTVNQQHSEKKTKQNKGMKIDNDEYKGWNQKAESVDYTACAH